MQFKQIVCPVSVEKVDSNVSRLTVFFNVLLMAFYLLTLNPSFILIVTLDYFIRAFFNVKFSPIRLGAITVSRISGLKKKPINLAQKIFASRLGFICAATASLLFFTGATTASIVVAGMLLLLATLDSVFNFCVGCIIYHTIVYPFYKNK